MDYRNLVRFPKFTWVAADGEELKSCQSLSVWAFELFGFRMLRGLTMFQSRREL